VALAVLLSLKQVKTGGAVTNLGYLRKRRHAEIFVQLNRVCRDSDPAERRTVAK
jgi:hypothetical protein